MLAYLPQIKNLIALCVSNLQVANVTADVAILTCRNLDNQLDIYRAATHDLQVIFANDNIRQFDQCV